MGSCFGCRDPTKFGMKRLRFRLNQFLTSGLVNPPKNGYYERLTFRVMET